MQVTFFGGAGGVTGSKHLIETESGTRVLLDCGTFQGLPDVRERNRSLPFPPESVDAVVLSHAHIDHCGMLPLLVKRGFTGPICSTPATKDVAQFMLKDAAGIEEQDAEWRARHKVGAPDDRTPLFTKADVPPTIKLFKTFPYSRHSDQWHQITEDIELKFFDAGHILGSAISLLRVTEDGNTKTLMYTGDVGAKDTPLLYDPEVPTDEVNHVLMESTYGSRRHDKLDTAFKRLAQVIGQVCERGGKIIIPAFSLGRTQAIVYILHKLTDEGAIPRFPIYVDSPLATNLTDVYREHVQEYDQETQEDFGHEASGPLAFRNLSYTQNVNDSKALNDQPGPFAVISASGMMTAGRVVHHLRHSISHGKNAILITGYQASGTLGRRLLEGAKRVELYGDWFNVKADIHVFNEFSAHADHAELHEYLEQISGIESVTLVHGEPSQADEFKANLKEAHPDWTVNRPSEGDSIQI